MRYFIGAEMGWLAVPFVFAVGLAYVWLAAQMLSRRKATPQVTETRPAATKAA